MMCTVTTKVLDSAIVRHLFDYVTRSIMNYVKVFPESESFRSANLSIAAVGHILLP